ncbi:hypothetical protein FHR70_002543 [Microvirga lupini]|uniref:Uncharacterized protein n=1 Tax=Microvirga lupini TaxID=420324 RepID=A0A7W4YXY4_9HYPH|nr:hypothetical protein [Microvirga lupini]
MPSSQAAVMNAAANAANHNNRFVGMCIDLPAGWQGTPATNRISVPPAA